MMPPHPPLDRGDPTRYGRTCRRGMVLVATLTCLLIVMAIVGSMLQHAIRARRQLHAERDRRQAELLVEAGACRAVALLARDPSFRGDTWNLAAEQVLGVAGARVTTEITPADMAADNHRDDADAAPDHDNPRWQLRVVAEYPLDRALAVRRTRTFPLNHFPTR